MRIVFDLDGTLADGKHREHFIIATEGREKPDWDAYVEACAGETPMWRALAVLHALWYAPMVAPHKIEIWSGRGEGLDLNVRRKTLTWLHGSNNPGMPHLGYFDETPSEFFAPERGEKLHRPTDARAPRLHA